MSDEEFDRDELCEAVGEDNDLEPLEKGMVIRWSKAGESPPSWIPYDGPVVWVYTEIRGPCRRLLQRDNFWPTELRDENGREIEPSERSGERITGVGGYIPRASVKLQSTIRSDSTHASVVSDEQSELNSSESSPDKVSEPLSEMVNKEVSLDGPTEAGQSATSTSTSPSDSNSVSTTDPLDW
jgi:hypothetical protein